MNKIKIIITLVSILLTQSIFSQDGEWLKVRDLESWNSLNLKYKINKKWSIGIEEQIRLNNNSSTIDAYFTELNSTYNFTKHFYGGIGFRYITQNDVTGKVQGLENHTRLHIDLGVKHEIQRLNLEYRLRFQTKNEIGKTKADGDYANKHLRLKVGMGYDLKNWKLDPEISTEIFKHSEEGQESNFDKLRFTIGTNYKTKSFGEFKLFYRIEKELNVSYPLTTNIVGIKYTYTLKHKKK